MYLATERYLPNSSVTVKSFRVNDVVHVLSSRGNERGEGYVGGGSFLIFPSSVGGRLPVIHCARLRDSFSGVKRITASPPENWQDVPVGSETSAVDAEYADALKAAFSDLS
jgi:hypothetical protein